MGHDFTIQRLSGENQEGGNLGSSCQLQENQVPSAPTNCALCTDKPSYDLGLGAYSVKIKGQTREVEHRLLLGITSLRLLIFHG